MGTSVMTIINGLNGELVRTLKQTVSTETLNRKNELTTKLLEVLEQHAAGEHKIFSNESLTGQGEKQALSTLGTEETVPKLKWMQRVVTDLEGVEQGYRMQFFTITSGIKDPAERMPIFTFLWTKLDVLVPSERIKQFAQAAESDELVILAAMLENPLGSMVNEEVQERVLTERAKRRFPQPYENFEQNALLLEFMTMARDWVGRWLFGEVGVEIQAIRDALGDELADMLTQQTTGLPQRDTELVSK